MEQFVLEVGNNNGTARLQFSNEIILIDDQITIKNIKPPFISVLSEYFPSIIYSAMYNFSLPKEPPILQIRVIRSRAFGKLG